MKNKIILLIILILQFTSFRPGQATSVVKVVEGNGFIARIWSVDHISNDYKEELLLLDNQRFYYYNILPHLSYYYRDKEDSFSENKTYRLLQRRRRVQWFSRNYLLHKQLIINTNTCNEKSKQLFILFKPYFQEIAKDDSSPIHRVGLNLNSWFNYGNKIQIHLRARLENKGEFYPQFAGRIWKDKLTGWIDNAAVYYFNNGFFASFGRSFLTWGPEWRDALLLSANSPAFDRIWLGYEHPLFRFEYLLAPLDDLYNNGAIFSRYLNAHRLSFRKAGFFELGLSEVVLYGRTNSAIEWHYLNPFVPYYWEQWNERTDDNILIGADFSLYPFQHTRFFGELLVDDFQVDFESEPHQVAYKLGIDHLGLLGLEKLYSKLTYTRVNTTVYGQNRIQNLYLHQSEPIGFFDGNDQDRLFCLLRYHLSQSFDLEMELQYTRKGEGRIAQHDSSAVAYEKKFPTGVVEKSPSIMLGVNFFNSFPMEGHCQFRYEHFENYYNISGYNHDRLTFNFFISFYLQGLIK